jgi:hypothetical protein
MRTLSSLAIYCLAVSSFFAVDALGQAAAEQAADPSGSWRWEREFNGNSMNFLLKLNWEDSKLTGDYTSFDSTSPIKEAKLEGNKLSFAVTREFNGNYFDVAFAGELDGDTIKGNTTMDIGGETREFEWLAKRSVEPADVVGSWKLLLDTPNGPFEPELKITEEGGKLKGTYSSVFGEIEAKDLTLKDNKLSWNISGKNDDFEWAASYEGEPRGDKISGTNDFDVNGNVGTMDFTGKREKKTDAATAQPAAAAEAPAADAAPAEDSAEKRPQRPELE